MAANEFNELLSAISDMMDRKLEPFKEDIRELKADVKELKTDVKELREDVDGLKADVKELREDVDGLKADVKELREDVDGLKADVKELREDVDGLKQSVKKLEFNQEHEILPRLQNIEECYISTYERYQEGISDVETLKSDMEVVKIVLQEHSEKLQEFY